MISSNPHYISGRKKFEVQDYAGALSDYNLSLEAEENPNVYSERAVVYYFLKQLDNSLADMDHAAELEPENPYRYSSRAYIRDAMGDTEGAIIDYQKAIHLDPEDSIAHNNLGLLQEKLGYKEKAKKNYERADQLADVDKLLNKIHTEQRNESIEREQQREQPKEASREEREELSIVAILRNTFLTKTGFKEYLAFIRNGFKRQ
ncbi:MAG: tetratricopeptide repeat protein [Flavobacteriales bacterium]|nr:tetratricopeptide repeat protein [Flavobacteriales bacterium]